jgi:hypothetical protein
MVDARDRLMFDAAPSDHVKFYLDHKEEISRLQDLAVEAME